MCGVDLDWINLTHVNTKPTVHQKWCFCLRENIDIGWKLQIGLFSFFPVLFSVILQSFFRLGNFLQLFVPFLLFFWQLLIIFGNPWHVWGTFGVFPFLTVLLSESFIIRIINNKQYIKDHFIALTSITTDRPILSTLKQILREIKDL